MTSRSFWHILDWLPLQFNHLRDFENQVAQFFGNSCGDLDWVEVPFKIGSLNLSGLNHSLSELLWVRNLRVLSWVFCLLPGLSWAALKGLAGQGLIGRLDGGKTPFQTCVVVGGTQLLAGIWTLPCGAVL